MHPHLARCQAIITDATRDVGASASTRLDPSKWSVAEIVEHVLRAYSGTTKGLERCLEQGPLASPLTLKQWVAQTSLIDLGYFPEGRPAPKSILPTGAVDLPALVASVPRELARLDEIAMRVKAAHGDAKVLDHPLLGAFTVDQWLQFHERHTAHHAKQIRRQVSPPDGDLCR